ncbi:ferredoxin family protein [Paenibacillus albicereus]|uniref:Ferredoxin family protein n=1 Tax=Paenibacillus albicereus TaxID=2726185 RepID=A0A6H2GTU3_9BACL|nr:ferredoxin family protein [Paenibacillus albicereus]QJC50812.1 ferredoxin family protein [Paenibacillus albicereus]
MIEIVSQTRCVGCSRCIHVCPTNVFAPTDSGVPAIARQSDCQTCFMCELYCPVDALYVAPDAEEIVGVTEQELEARGALGGYREQVGWGRGRKPVSSHELLVQLAARTPF